ncbi:MAG: hypothetical protein EA359_18950 [Balneolaceae bacterium]|nr:MAG: hypothetical protein EA359_18950 [Balneolaceae bacterium]
MHQIKRSNYFKSVLILAVIFMVSPIYLVAQNINVQASFNGDEWIDRRTPISIEFDRELTTEDGRPSLWIGTDDVTGIMRMDGNRMLYPSDRISLPSGKHKVKVFLVNDEDNWNEIAQFPLNVRTIGGIEELSATPGLTLTNKGQFVEEKRPIIPESDRPTFQDITGQLNMKALAIKNDWQIDLETQIVGVSFEREALRFRDLGEDAPRIDLARYQVNATNRGARITAGHLRHGQHQHLLNNFQSRGLMYRQEIDDYLDLTVAGTYASNAVGWSNLAGFTDPGHRIISGTVGFDAIENLPGALRMEATTVFGAKEPRNSFNQEAILDSETSRGAGLRLLSTLWDRRIRTEASVALSSFRNPNDRNLSRGEELVPVFTENRMAWHADMNAQLIRNMDFLPRAPLNMRTGYTFTRIDPLYEAVGVFVRGDIEEHQFSATTGAGPLSVNLQHRRNEDNLDNLPSVLKTLSRQYNIQVQLNTSTLVGSDSFIPSWVLPNLGYSYNYVHQFGAGVPPEGGFDASHVPDQKNYVYQFSTAWQKRNWSASYRFQNSFQDNRQPGRENNDFIRNNHVVAFRIAPVSMIDISTNLNFDLNKNRANNETEIARRLGFNLQLRPVNNLNLRGSYQPSRRFDRADTRLQTQTQISAEATWRFSFLKYLQKSPSASVYIRFSRQETFRIDPFRDEPDENMIWTLQSGVTLNLF